ncbi:phytoene synthase [Brachybacterium phenoliresistens]|uniref:Phytoene synthase n=1 Tax=Brachybacterium phenoliresistens TaxID=396014 RepID=Z9JU61_9MICO|nr:squalene/phytoene synthase family protein [Brachybacterium phenoliresistens]EWS81523.1 phytoene synthase [Brachybacterium phenoliresistens]
MISPLDAQAAAAYRSAASSAAAAVIGRYSTSFALSARLLREPVRTRVRCIYALVRVADEIVDGAARGSGLGAEQIAASLDAYEAAVEAARETGFSTDLVIHAFARTARETGIGPELTAPFFASMRMDLERSDHTPETFARYVHGSAEVVGLMCLRVFATDRSPTPVEPDARLVEGARRLGAAFQKVNFLRDLHADADARGRAYFPGIDPARLTDAQRDLLLDDVDADLAAARAAIVHLPASSRAAVLAAHDLFAELSARLRATPAARLRTRRVRVPDLRKACIAARAVAVARRVRV